MDPAAITTEGLTKHYGSFAALADLDLEVAAGRGPRLPRAERRRQDHHHPAPARPHPADRRPGRDLRARRAGASRSRRTAASPTSPARSSLWPSLTGAETLHLLGESRAASTPPTATELIERFELDPSKKVRAYSKGNRQKLMLIAALMTAGRPAPARRAHERARPLDGAGLPPLRARGARAGPDGVPVVAHPQRGRGALRPGRDPAPAGGSWRSARCPRCGTSRRCQRRGHLRRLGRPTSRASPASASSSVDGQPGAAARSRARSSRSSRCWRRRACTSC